jgi:SPP1 family predicted phage head-tail adaptor
MKSGDLKHPVKLERVNYITDSSGNRRADWKVYATVWASKADVSGRDFYAAQAHQALDVITFGIRWRDDIDTECRIVHDGQVYEIVQINRLGYKRDFMHIKAKVLQGKGV